MILLTAGEQMDRLFDLDWQLLSDSCLMIIAIFVLFLVMSYFLFNPARQVLNNRKAKIKGELDDAKKNMEDAQQLRAQYEEKIKNIDKEAEAILSEARKRALANETEIIEKARQEAAHIMEKAHMEAKLEKQKIADEVKKDMINVATLMASKAVATSMDVKIQESLVDETLREIGDNTWLS